MRTPDDRPRPHSDDPLHGVTLERILTELVDHYGWDAMGERVRVRCFTSDPSVTSSLKFLRRTPWARHKVEAMYRALLRTRARTARPRAPAPGVAAPAPNASA